VDHSRYGERDTAERHQGQATPEHVQQVMGGRRSYGEVALDSEAARVARATRGRGMTGDARVGKQLRIGDETAGPDSGSGRLLS